MKKIFILSIIIGIAGGAALAGLTSPSAFQGGWLAYGLLLAVSAFVMLIGWRKAGAGRALGWMLVVAFLVRLSAGVTLQLVLPVAGYDEEVQKAGYVFFDAYQRDNQAWELATSDQSLTAAFRGESFISDQYGGLLALSAATYRLLSPDFHRPTLILILTALFGALSVLFTLLAVRKRWGERAAGIVGWVMVLYPEAVLMGASQMREPFLIALFRRGLLGIAALAGAPPPFYCNDSLQPTGYGAHLLAYDRGDHRHAGRLVRAGCAGGVRPPTLAPPGTGWRGAWLFALGGSELELAG